MSHYRDRTGQRIGNLEVLSDHSRTRAGKVIWKCWDHGTGRECYLRSDRLARLAREHGTPAPPVSGREP